MEEKKKSKLPLIFNILLVIIVSYLAYEVSVLSQKNHAFKQEISEMIKENEEMNQIIINQDIVSEADGENLKENLKLLLFSYDSLEQNNSVAIDSINRQREKKSIILCRKWISWIKNLSEIGEKFTSLKRKQKL